MLTKFMIAVSLIVLIVSIAKAIRKIHTCKKFRKSFGDYIKNAMRPENTMTFAELEEKYGGDDE